MKICLQSIISREESGGVDNPIEVIAKSVAGPDTQLVFSYPDVFTIAVHHAYFEYHNKLRVIEGIVQAEKEGCDAVIVTCHKDPGVPEARDAVSIPVLGVLESALHFASILGHRFAIIAPLEKFVPQEEELIRLYGLQGKAISNRPVRGMGMGTEFYAYVSHDPKRVRAKFEEAARSAVADGAEVLVPGCGSLTQWAMQEGMTEFDGAPVVNPVAVAVKMAEALVDLGREPVSLRFSRKCLYRLPSQGARKKFEDAFEPQRVRRPISGWDHANKSTRPK